MEQEKIKKLEELIGALVKEVRSLRIENGRLEGDNIRLARELEAGSADVKKNQGKLERLALLERSFHKMETGNVAARVKIQSMLAELEKADWS